MDKQGGKGFHYRRLFTVNVYDGGCKRLQWRVQTFTMADANVYDGGCKRLRWRVQTFAMADANVYGKKHILLGNQILSGQYLFPEASYSSRERPWEKTALLPYLVWKSIMRAMAR